MEIIFHSAKIKLSCNIFKLSPTKFTINLYFYEMLTYAKR